MKIFSFLIVGYFPLLIWLFVLIGITEGKGLCEEPDESPSRKRILVLLSLQMNDPANQAIYQAICRRFETPPRNAVIDCVELNAFWNSRAEYHEKFTPLLKPIKEGRYDMIVAVYDEALELLLEHHKELPANLPIVYSGFRSYSDDFLARYPNLTAIGGNDCVEQNIRLGLQLMPQTREIAIISDSTPAGYAVRERLKTKYQNEAFKLTQLSSEHYDSVQLLQALEALPDDSFVIFCGWCDFRDKTVPSVRALARKISQLSGKPWFIVTDRYAGFGGLGGYQVEAARQGELTADVMENVFWKGVVGRLTPQPISCRIDMAVLSQAGLNPEKLPSHAIRLNQAGFFADFRWWEIGGWILFAIACLGGVIVGGAFRIYRRRNDLFMKNLPMRIVVVAEDESLLFRHVESTLDEGEAKIHFLRDIPDLELDRVRAVIEKVRLTGKRQSLFYQYRGNYRVAVFLLPPSGLFARNSVMWISQDISEQKVSQQREEETRRILAMILEHIPGCVVVKEDSDDLRIVQWNRSMEKMIGISAGMAIGKSDFELPIDREWCKLIRSRDREALESGQIQKEKETFTDLAGQEHHLEVIRIPLKVNADRSFLISLTEDVSCLVRLERLLNDAQSRNQIVLRQKAFYEQLLIGFSGDGDSSGDMQELLRLLGEVSGAEHCYFYRYTEENPQIAQWTAEWSGDGVAAYRKLHPVWNMSQCPAWKARLSQKTDICFDPHNPSEVFEAIAGDFAGEKDIEKIFAAGLFIKGKLCGFLGGDFGGSADFEGVPQMFHCALAWLGARECLPESTDQPLFWLNRIWDEMDVPVILQDSELRVLCCNRAYTRLTGKSSEEIKGRFCSDGVCYYAGSSAICDEEHCPVRKTARLGRQTVLETFEHKNRLYQISSKPLFDSRNVLKYVLTSVLDVTHPTEQRHQQAANTLFLSRAAEMAHLTYFKGDRYGAVEVLGGDAVGWPTESSFNLTDWVLPEERRRVRMFLEELFVGKEGNHELSCSSKSDGETRHFLLRVMFLQPGDSHYLGICHDVTDAYRAETAKNEWISTLNGYVATERIINGCLAKIVQNDDFETNLRDILSIIATELGADRVVIGDYQQGRDRYQISHEWHNGIAVAVRGRDSAAIRQMFDELEPLFQSDGLWIEMDMEHRSGGLLFSEIHTRVAIGAPIMVNRKLYGALSVGFMFRTRSFDEREQNLMRSAAKIISLLIEHSRQTEAVNQMTHERQIIFENIKVPIWFLDATGKVLRINPAGVALCGISQNEIIGKSCFLQLCKNSDFPPQCPFKLALETKMPCMREIQIGGRSLQVFANPIMDAAGNVTHVIESGMDVTELNSHRAELEKAAEAARAADRAKSYFLATMSHEIRTPLNAVIGFSELLQNHAIPAQEQDEYLKSINFAGKALLHLINDVLDLSKIEANQVRIIPAPSDLKELLEEIKAIFRQKAQEKGISFEVHYPAALPDLLLDAMRVKQIVLNLVGNALKFTEKGRVVVEATYQEESSRLNISVCDTGIGISAEFMPRLFTAFSQQASEGGKFEGTGLGLTISRQLAEKMGGTLTCQSESGKGSFFTLTLPAVGRVIGKRAPSTTNQMQPTMRLRALLVDDVPMNLRILESMLARFGVTSHSVTSGDEAWKILHGTEVFDLLLTDIWMPGLNGSELAERIREQHSFDSMRIIAVTADADTDAAYPVKDFDLLLYKPLTLEKVGAMLRKLNGQICE